MAYLSFPLRLRNTGMLKRTDEPTAVLAFLEAMALTPGGSWPACPDFGLRDLLENPQRRADTPRLAQERANRALTALSIDNFHVSSIAREIATRPGVETYAVILLSNRSDLEYHYKLATPLAS